jgi:hypothetical protein
MGIIKYTALIAGSLLAGSIMGAYFNRPTSGFEATYECKRAFVIQQKNGFQWGLVEKEKGKFIPLSEFMKLTNERIKDMNKETLEKSLINF